MGEILVTGTYIGDIHVGLQRTKRKESHLSVQDIYLICSNVLVGLLNSLRDSNSLLDSLLNSRSPT